MKLRTKILILTIAAFLLGGYSIAATGIVKVTEMADTSARTQMSLLVTNFANEIDDSLGRFSTILSANVFPTESDLYHGCFIELKKPLVKGVFDNGKAQRY